MKQTQKQQERLEYRFEHTGYGFKSVYKKSEMFFILNMEYRKENNRRVYLNTPQPLTEIMTPEGSVNETILHTLSVEWLEEEANLKDFLDEEFETFQDLENYEDDPYKEEYF